MRLGYALVRRVAVAAWLTVCSLASPAMAGTVMVPVRLPLTGTRDTQVEAAVLRSLGQLRDAAPERGTAAATSAGRSNSPASSWTTGSPV
jgi:hypothetical protein